LLYRSEDNSAQRIGNRSSRLGYAFSKDGMNFKKCRFPVLYPAKDSQFEQEMPGGCEDPRIARRENGTYVLLYTQWNRKVPRLAVATSKDLKSWTKFGSVFKMAFAGKFFNEPTKSVSIVTKVVRENQVIAKINGKYFMYWGEKNVYAATSDDLISWTPILNSKGDIQVLFSPRAGFFDSELTEVGHLQYLQVTEYYSSIMEKIKPEWKAIYVIRQMRTVSVKHYLIAKIQQDY